MDILSRVNELLDRKLYEATILSDIGRVARSLVQFDETFTSVMGLVARVAEFTVGAMAFVEGDDLEVVIMVHRPAAASLVEEAKGRLLDAIARERDGAPFARVQARLFTPAAMAGAVETALGTFCAYPVMSNGRLTGLLALAGRALIRAPRDTEVFLGQVANQAHIVMENSRLFERVKNLSIRDGLTDLYNHRHAQELVKQELERAGRYRESFSVLMLDIDHFKAVNDAHGHQAGDLVLREVARHLRETVRAVDAVGRYGGEEFLVVLPHTDAEEARQTAERLRAGVEARVFRAFDRDLKITISVGTATYPGDRTDSPADLIGHADKALYQAKQGGRNRVG